MTMHTFRFSPPREQWNHAAWAGQTSPPMSGLNVHLTMNRITDKQFDHLGHMTEVAPGEFEVSLDLPDTLIASYCFTVTPKGQPRPMGPSRGGFEDPSCEPYLPGFSLFRGSAAPAHPAWDATLRSAAPQVAGAVYHADDVLEGRRVSLYRPDEPCRHFLVIFDANKWFDQLNLPAALTWAHQQGILPAISVLGIHSLDSQDRLRQLAANQGFLDEVWQRAVPWAQSQLDDSLGDSAEPGNARAGRPDAGKTVVAGQSLGGIAALMCADRVDAVIAQSPSMWVRPGATNPRALESHPGDPWITTQAGVVESHAEVSVSVGLRELALLPRVVQGVQAWRAMGKGVSLTFVDGGHDMAWWRQDLLDQLARSL